MKYFYACLPNEKDLNSNLIEGISKECVYIDQVGQENKHWSELLKVLQKNDELSISSIDQIAFEDVNLKSKLKSLKKLNVELFDGNDEKLNIDTLLQLIDFVEIGRKNRVKKLQKKGIDKALEKKYKGEGRFGRPNISVPDDFEENIKKITEKKMSHDVYRESLGMKRSTYYKLVKDIKDSWLTENDIQKAK